MVLVGYTKLVRTRVSFICTLHNRVRQNPSTGGEIPRCRTFGFIVADPAQTGNEDHASPTDVAHMHRIMTGTGRHDDMVVVKAIRRVTNNIHDFLIEFGGSDERNIAHLDTARRADVFCDSVNFIADHAQYIIVGMTKIDCEVNLAGDRVRRSG